ncbi:hypothetical protein Ahy_B04g071806 [Arachis hypogaea]|uniref:Uncharacterized protein n=1 Tax=Arachis hypogaea TaxID=3818 RepID=A0A444ZLM1_ARAHY|nr:hypothetical protein Ahy_B04g071806 [Arachis hypogaea]
MLEDIVSWVLTNLSRAPDLQRGVTRIFHCTAKPVEIVGIDCLNHFVFPKFVAVIQAILSAGKQLQQLNIREEENNNLRSNLLRRLILSASSDSVIANATKMLSSLNKESADQGDLTNLIIASEAQFPEVTRARKAFRMEEEQLNSLIGLYRKRLGAEFGIHECFWNYSFDRGYSLKHLNYFFVCCLLETDVKVPSNWIKIDSNEYIWWKANARETKEELIDREPKFLD